MAIRMKEWGMLAPPGQPVHVRTQGLYGWERVGRNVGEGLGALLQGGVDVLAMEKVNSAGELAAFSQRLRSISAEVGEELREQEVQDWDYSWNAAATPRLNEAVQELSAESRRAGAELARMYSAQASIETRREREVQRVATARGRWEQQVDAAISAGQEEQAARWLQAGRGVFVPEGQMAQREQEVRSRACRSRWETGLQASPLETLGEWASAGRKAGVALPAREEDGRALRRSCERVRGALRRELAQVFSERLHAGEDVERATLELAARAGVIPAGSVLTEGTGGEPDDAARLCWLRWLDLRAEGEESEVAARLSIAAAPLPLAERRTLLERLERTAKVPAADRHTLCRQLFSLYHSGALGCPGDAVAERSLLGLLNEGAQLLAEQGAGAAAEWLKSRCGGDEGWVCYEAQPKDAQR